MRSFLTLALLVFATLFGSLEAKAVVIGNSAFTHVIYLSGASSLTSTKSGTNSGKDYSSPKGFFDADLWDIPANVVIENVYFVVDEAVVGITKVNVGDDDSASGFIASASGSLSTTGLHYWDLDYKGAYLKGGIIVTNDLQAKLYTATGKELKLDITGTASAGKARLIVTGYAVGIAQ